MFDWNILRTEDRLTAQTILHILCPPDLIIAPDGDPYLYRWHVVHNPEKGNIYFHIQVASDPERPLHDHPWDNTSNILSGRYIETIQFAPPNGKVFTWERQTGQFISREATDAHRLILPPGVPYVMTLFMTGPKKRKWGFWYGEKWVPYDQVTKREGNFSTHIKPEKE